MLFVKQLQLLLGACFFSCVGADAGDDFSNNLFTDLAPLLALFGERVTMQYMSVAMGWADNILLAMAPLGIITAIVGAIRVGGPSWLKTIIGRARESRAIQEAELLSSTSTEVCELWNGHEIVRVMGKGPIREFVIVTPKKDYEETRRKSKSPSPCQTSTQRESTRKGRTASTSDHEQELVVMSLEEQGEPPYLKRQKISLKERIRGKLMMNGFADEDEQYQSDSSAQDRDPERGERPRKEQEVSSKTDPISPKGDARSAVISIVGTVPNITVNLSSRVGRAELYFAAACGVVLQLGVLVYFGISATIFRPKLLKDQVPVADYALPCTVIGTVLLVSGIAICAHVVEGSTTEETYCPSYGKQAQIVWLQRSGTVNDQVFGSFAILSKRSQALVTTSQRLAESSKETSPRQKEKQDRSRDLEQFFAVTGTAVCLLGFIVQFIGLRGMHWSASIAQLGAIGIMTGLRVWVRRDLAQLPESYSLIPDHELDWMAQELFKDPKLESFKSGKARQGTPDAKGDWEWKVSGVEDPDKCEELTPAASSDTQTLSPADKVMKLRRNLGKLADWQGPASTEAICLARSIEITMDALCSDMETDLLTWSFDISGELVHFRLKREQTRTWKAFADELEAALSMWLFSICKIEKAKKDDNKAEDTEKSHDEESKDDDAWLRAKGTVPQPCLRLLGTYSPALDQSLRWWMPNGNASIVELDPDLAGKGRQIGVERHRITGFASGSASERLFSMKPQGRLLLFDSNPCTLDVEKADPGNKANSMLAVESNYPLKTMLAQHMFSVFMVAVAKKLKEPVSGRVEVRPTDVGNDSRDSAWKSFRLRHAELSRMVQDIQSTGLGTLEDVYLSVIPPLSSQGKLPQADAVVQLARKQAQVHEKRENWQEAAEAYIWLFQVSRTLPEKSSIRIKATALLLEYLRVLKSATKLRKAQMIDEDAIHKLEEVGKEIEKHLQLADKVVLASVLRLHEMQSRPWKSGFGTDPDNSAGDSIKALNFTELHQKACDNDPSDLGGLMRSRGIAIDDRDMLDWTPFHYAAAKTSGLALMFLLYHRPDINAREIHGQTPLHLACLGGDERCVWMLLRAGADAGMHDTDGLVPLHCAAASGDEKAVQWLIEAGADINALDRLGNTPLHWAAYKGELKTVEYLVRETNTKLRNQSGQTALHLSVSGDTDNKAKQAIIKYMINERPADMEAKDRLGRTPLHNAAFVGQKAIVRLLLHQGALVEAKDSLGRTPLHWAAGGGNVNIVQLFLNRGTMIETKDSEGKTPLHIAAFGGNLETIQLLLDRGAIIDVKDSKGKTPLHDAAFGGNLETIQLLLDRGAIIDVKDSKGKTPLHDAALWENLETIQLLLDRDAMIEAKDNEGKTPLHNAAFWNRLEATKLLLDQGAMIEAKDSEGKTPLHNTAFFGILEIMQLLLDRGAMIDVKDSKGETPLHNAAFWKHLENMQLLLDRGAMIDVKDSEGKTPLLISTENGHTEAVQLLLDRGAMIEVKDSEGKTPLIIATEKQHEEVVQLLIARGAKRDMAPS